MITIDASAIIKIIITEDDSAIARRAFSKLTEDGEPLLSPDIVLSEAMNGLWKHYTLRKDISLQNLEAARNSLKSIYDNLEISNQVILAEDAFNVSIRHKITFYDSLYTALSMKMKAPLFTFDKKLKEKAKGMGLDLLDPEGYQSP